MKVKKHQTKIALVDGNLKGTRVDSTQRGGTEAGDWVSHGVKPGLRPPFLGRAPSFEAGVWKWGYAHLGKKGAGRKWERRHCDLKDVLNDCAG